MNATIIYRGVTFDVEYDFQPEEKQTWDDPGCPAEVDITCIEHKGTDFTEFFFEYGYGRDYKNANKEIAYVKEQLEQLIWDARAEEYGRD